MKTRTFTISMIILILAITALTANVMAGPPEDLGWELRSTVQNYPNIIVANSQTGCRLNYSPRQQAWAVWEPGGPQVWSGSLGTAINVLLFSCGQ